MSQNGKGDNPRDGVRSVKPSEYRRRHEAMDVLYTCEDCGINFYAWRRPEGVRPCKQCGGIAAQTTEV